MFFFLQIPLHPFTMFIIAQNSPLSRASAISILRQVLRTLYMLKDEYPEQVETSVKDVLPRWLEVMGRVVGGDVGLELVGDWEGLKVRNEIFKVSFVPFCYSW